VIIYPGDMSSAKLAIACGFAAVVVSACGATSNPPAGTVSPTATSAGHAKLDDPRTKHAECLRQNKIPVTEVGRTWLQIGVPGTPKVHFASTAGAAQGMQISGQIPGAEVIGSALLFPEQASESVLSTIEDCLAQGVKG
jgi:hypothetical protein